LNATSERRGSLQALPVKDRILATIQLDLTMRKRWERYNNQNYYAEGIEFDDVIGAMIELLSSV
jgi:hypothetical protein